MNDGIIIDVDKCSGCYACAVACMESNDLKIDELGQCAWRIVHKVEKGEFPDAKISYVSLSCMHCEDAPCVIACPTGAIKRDPVSGVVDVNPDLCIGCHSCSIACPFGVPRFGYDGKMQKCNLCLKRITNGLEPACVRVCPTKALKFGPINQIMNEVSDTVAKRLVALIKIE